MAPERILLVGAAGSGKTYAILRGAAYLPGLRWRVVDTDNAYARMLTGEFGNLANLEYRVAHDWASLQEVTAWAFEDSDVVAVDRVDLAWQWVRDYYADEVMGTDLATVLVNRRKQNQSDRPMLVGEFGQGDWGVINRCYSTWWRQFRYASQHIIATTVPTQYRVDEGPDRDRSLTQALARAGIRPAGQRQLSHEVHTVLLLSYNGGYVYWGLKDRQRPQTPTQPTPLVDFGLQYLGAIAGLGGEGSV